MIKANVLNQYFSSVFTVENATQIQAASEDDHEVPAMQPITINSDGLARP